MFRSQRTRRRRQRTKPAPVYNTAPICICMLSKEKVVFFYFAWSLHITRSFAIVFDALFVCMCEWWWWSNCDRRASRTQMLLDKGLYRNYMFMHVLHRGNQLKESSLSLSLLGRLRFFFHKYFFSNRQCVFFYPSLHFSSWGREVFIA